MLWTLVTSAAPWSFGGKNLPDSQTGKACLLGWLPPELCGKQACENGAEAEEDSLGT